MFMNLLSNALKFSKKGGVIEVKVIRTKLETGGEQIQVSVKDKGVGIKQED